MKRLQRMMVPELKTEIIFRVFVHCSDPHECGPMNVRITPNGIDVWWYGDTFLAPVSDGSYRETPNQVWRADWQEFRGWCGWEQEESELAELREHNERLRNDNARMSALLEGIRTKKHIRSRQVVPIAAYLEAPTDTESPEITDESARASEAAPTDDIRGNGDRDRV